jgi:shikimate kinase
MAQNIFLVGPMGAGKTTIGKQLARTLGRSFFDSDQEIRNRTGADIPLIFELEGEAGFRQREKAVIDELTQKHLIILGTGGGAVLDPENRRHLSERGFVIYLSAPIQLLLNRTAHDKSRPLLQTENPRKRLEEILNERDPLYREVADYVVTTDNRPARTVVKAILALVKEHDL